MNEPNYVITLVHGTFAKNALWIQPESDFCSLLKKNLKGTILFQPFVWSGVNSHKARSIAAAELATKLADSIVEFPESNHCVVAHSHGGNLALQAQANKLVRGRLTGIVTLGTPFVSCSARKVGPSVGVVLLAVPEIVFFIVLIATGILLLTVTLRPDVSESSGSGIRIAYSVFFAVFVMPMLFFARDFLKAKRKRY
jgi:hypothetical protein